MNAIQNVLLCIAIPATLILVIQTCMQLFSAFGGGGDGSSDADTQAEAAAPRVGTDAATATSDGRRPETTVNPLQGDETICLQICWAAAWDQIG